MKLLDIVGTGAKAVKAAAVAVAAVVAPAPRQSPEALEELERRARINAEGDAERARRARTWNEVLDAGRGGPSWLGSRRRGWLR
jgi:hypothetical protein